MTLGQRQEVLNVLLAELLQERGAIVAPETIQYTGSNRKKQMPDVIVTFQGLRIAIEGEVHSAAAQTKALNSATGRVETGLAHIGVGVVYPAHLRNVNFADAKSELAKAQLRIAVVTEITTTTFTTGTVNDLERVLRSTFEQLVQEDVVAESVAMLDVAVDKFAVAAVPERGNWVRITQFLNRDLTETELNKLTPKQRMANCRIGGLVMLNAIIFHDILSRHQPDVTPLHSIIATKDYNLFPKQWDYVIKNINYFAIFSIARSIWLKLSMNTPGMIDAIELMVDTANKISQRRAALRHDLMGRIYHRLLTDAKYLGTYYTSIPAATILLKLALHPDRINIDWTDPQAIGNLRVADLSCGTGTLLMAAADALIDGHISVSAAQDIEVKLNEVHHQIAEAVLFGYDILPSAIHLTASTLAMGTPDIPLKRQNLFSLPYGGTERKLGSIEFVRGRTTQTAFEFDDLFGAIDKPKQIEEKGSKAVTNAPLPDLDLCVMNPPFVSSRHSNMLFGSIPDADRPAMQKKLKALVKDTALRANVTAGLGAVFVAVGDRAIKPGGRIALVLPKALLSGVSWQETRNLINQYYVMEYIFASQDPDRWNFSDSTALSETMIIARKRNKGETTSDDNRTVIINLWRNPTNMLEALAVTNAIKLENNPPDLVTGQSAYDVMVGKDKWGESVSMRWNDLKTDWMLPASFAQHDLMRVGYYLAKGTVWIPGEGNVGTVALKPLGLFADTGPDGRDIYDGFDPVETFTPYPALWGHKSDEIRTIEHNANKTSI